MGEERRRVYRGRRGGRGERGIDIGVPGGDGGATGGKRVGVGG